MSLKKTARRKTNIKRLSHGDVPASVRLVKEVRDELRSEIQSVKHELKGEIQHLRGELKGEIQHLRGELKGEIHEVKSDLQKVLVAVHGTQVLVEEQRSENRIVLDGIKMVMERQDRVEAELHRRPTHPS